MSVTLALTPATAGIDRRAPIQQSSVDTANLFLGKNHKEFHLFFNNMGFHNHIVHHMMTIYALGATSGQLKQAFESNATYQKPQKPVNEENVAKLEDKAYMHSILGKDEHFQDLLQFFDRRMERDGWQTVANEYLFSGSDLAEDILLRMYGGVWHPLLLFGFGVEFEQPRIVAESLAEAACHAYPYRRFFLECEKLAQHEKRSTPLVEIIRQIQADPSLHDAKHFQGGNSFNEFVIGDAPQGLIDLVAQWRVNGTEELDYKTAESANVNAWMAGAAQRRDREIKFDFIGMHQVNVSIFFSSFNKQSWISDANKIRLLERMTRLDMLQYAAELAPPLYIDEIVNYVPAEQDLSWEGIVERVNGMIDDGHVSKLIRALAHGRDISAGYEAADAQKAVPELPIKGDMWLQLANMVWDSTWKHAGQKRWVRGAGSDEAWSVFAGRKGK